jgi:hypothetical protein
MPNANGAASQQAVAVGLEDLRNSKQICAQRWYWLKADVNSDSVEFSLLEDAFGPASLGIIVVKDLPSKFHKLRHKLLSYSSALGNLPQEELGV